MKRKQYVLGPDTLALAAELTPAGYVANPQLRFELAHLKPYVTAFSYPEAEPERALDKDYLEAFFADAKEDGRYLSSVDPAGRKARDAAADYDLQAKDAALLVEAWPRTLVTSNPAFDRPDIQNQQDVLQYDPEKAKSFFNGLVTGEMVLRQIEASAEANEKMENLFVREGGQMVDWAVLDRAAEHDPEGNLVFPELRAWVEANKPHIYQNQYQVPILHGDSDWQEKIVNEAKADGRYIPYTRTRQEQERELLATYKNLDAEDASMLAAAEGRTLITFPETLKRLDRDQFLIALGVPDKLPSTAGKDTPEQGQPGREEKEPESESIGQRNQWQNMPIPPEQVNYWLVHRRHVNEKPDQTLTGRETPGAKKEILEAVKLEHDVQAMQAVEASLIALRIQVALNEEERAPTVANDNYPYIPLEIEQQIVQTQLRNARDFEPGGEI